MPLPKIKLEIKLVLLFVTISVLPIILINYLWFTFSKTQVLDITAAQEKNSVDRASDTIKDFFTSKETSLIIHSQSQEVFDNNLVGVTADLHNFLFQDADIQDLSLLDQNGQELVHISRDKDYPADELTDQSQSAVFKVTTFLSGEPYISQVYYAKSNLPVIDIAVPVVQPNSSQNLQNLTTASPNRARQPGEIKGVLKETVALPSLWKSLSKIKIGDTGYVFLVDGSGNILFHPNTSFITNQSNFKSLAEVNRFLNAPDSITQNGQEVVSQSKNEYNQMALTTHLGIEPNGWAIIGQVPMSDALDSLNRVTTFTIVLFIIILSLVILLSLLVSEHIIEPIDKLRTGSDYIGQGNFNYRLNIKSRDEIEDLGNSFNKMTANLEEAFKRLERDRDIISSERNKSFLTLQSISDGVIVTDRQRKIIIFNRAAENITGFALSQILNHPISEVLKLSDKNGPIDETTYCPINDNNFEGTVFSEEEVNLVGSASKQSTVNISSGQIKEGVKVNLGCIITMHDITREKQLEEMRLDFVSMAAHELRTPLTSIRGYLSVFIDENSAKLNKDQNMLLTRINIASQQLITLIENILSVSKIERGSFAVSLTAIDWMSSVQQTFDQFIERAKEKNIELTLIKPTQTDIKVKADNVRINEVLSNLLANAITYTQTGGKVEVSVETKGNDVITSVKDSGEGIPPEALPHLFTKFFRVSGKLEQGSKGTGLGLYISKSIIEMHHGKIWVESQLGKGSTFRFSLPLT